MLRKPASIIILSLLVVSALALAFNVQPVKSDYTWTEPIYIMADGSIQPPTAPISSVDGVTYTLTDNIMGKVTTYSSAIIIQRDNITIDGARYMLQGTRAIESIGIELKGRSNVTIKNMKITTFGNGITLDSSSNNSVSANNIANNGYIGIVLQSSSNSTIYHNDFMNNSAHQAYSYNSTNVWDDGYPSGGNYWSDYNGTDIMYGPNQNMTGSDGMGDTAYVIDANKRDCYPLTHPWAPPDIAILSTWSSYYGQITTHSGIVSINVNVKNNGKKAEASNLQVYANNSVIGSQPLFLLPQSTRSQNFTWNTAGYCGQYQISAYAQPLPEELNTSNNRFVDGSVTVSGKGYFILVAGNCYGSLLAAINYGCNQVYKILRSVGYGPDDILYMNQQSIGPQDVDGDGINDIDCWSSSANLQWAIETWARSRVSPSQPLFIYLFDHGGSDLFCINEPDEVSSYQLASWLDYLQNATGASVHVIYAACHSGSFINELSKSGRVIVTSCAPAEFSKTGPDGNWEVFSIPFWNQVKSGHSVLSSFNYAYSAVAPKWFWQYWWPFCICWPTQTPLLDDNGDGVGHGGPLPKNGDGNLANNLYIGACEWPDPYISEVMPRLYSSWPPSNVTLWATVENETNLSNVTAWMLPPDWSPPNSTDSLLSLDLECFEMTDVNHDGNWTVNIPAVNFTNHASNPANFTFFITAEQENGDMATPSLATIAFSESGMPPQDTVSPTVNLERPLEGSVVTGTVELNGTASDDVCLDRVEVYADDTLLGTVVMPTTSTSYFEFGLDTTIFPNGNNTVLVKVYDKSGNSDNETVTIFVENNVHDVSVPNISISREIISQGSTAQIGVTVANHGSYSETFNLTVYANTTLIVTQLVTLSDQNYTTLALTWNTTGFALGNYTIGAYATPVQGEINTADNTFVSGTVEIIQATSGGGAGRMPYMD